VQTAETLMQQVETSFSERELTRVRYMLSPVRLSVVCMSSVCL